MVTDMKPLIMHEHCLGFLKASVETGNGINAVKFRGSELLPMPLKHLFDPDTDWLVIPT